MPDSSDDLVEWVKELALNAETTVVITSVSILEDWVKAAIKARTRDLSSKLEERLFSGYGPLNSFAGKIDIAYAFNIIEGDVYNDLRALKDIRNAFAHSTENLHLNSPTLAPLLQKLTGWAKGADARDLFNDRVSACVEALKVPLNEKAFIKALMKWKPEQTSSPEKSGEQPPRHPDDPGETSKNGEAPPQS
jgi:DNA-binding MltR family transcriptional regulator